MTSSSIRLKDVKAGKTAWTVHPYVLLKDGSIIWKVERVLFLCKPYLRWWFELKSGDYRSSITACWLTGGRTRSYENLYIREGTGSVYAVGPYPSQELFKTYRQALRHCQEMEQKQRDEPNWHVPDKRFYDKAE